MTAKEKVAQRKLSMLQLAEELGNVSRACKIMGYSRSQFYEIKRAFQTGGLEALLDRPPIPVTTPNKVAEEIEAKVIELSVEHPAWGQMRVREKLRRPYPCFSIYPFSLNQSIVFSIVVLTGVSGKPNSVTALELSKCSPIFPRRTWDTETTGGFLVMRDWT